MTQFTELGLSAPILSALAAEGYRVPTPIQAQAIPHVLAGRDLLGLAATGTGKTAAFALPILHRLAGDPRQGKAGRPRALVLSPTRELAAQIADSFRTYGRNLPSRVAVLIGGASFGPQTEALARGVDILVATPGRLLDHVGRGTARLDGVEVLVLDEADHMLDLGFIPAIRRLLRHLPAERRNLFFSATMPKEIETLASEILRHPVRVAVTPPATPAERIDQRAIRVESREKTGVLAGLLRERDGARVLVFTRTKRGADRVVRGLAAARVAAAAIHGNKSQGQRTRALAGFRDGTTPVLVATDIAARGIDIDDVNLVVNYDLPHVPETYVHRIGRTARAGASGSALSFCAGGEVALLRAIEKLIRRAIPVEGGPLPAELSGREPVAPAREPVARPRPRGRGPRRQRSEPSRPARAEREPRPAPRFGAEPAAAPRPTGAATGANGAALSALPFMRGGERPRRPGREAGVRRPVAFGV